MDTVTSYNNQTDLANRIVVKGQIHVVHEENEKMRETKKEAQTVQAMGLGQKECLMHTAAWFENALDDEKIHKKYDLAVKMGGDFVVEVKILENPTFLEKEQNVYRRQIYTGTIQDKFFE